MIELTILCEGPSEAEFVSQVLKPHFEGRAWCKPVPLNKRNFGVVHWPNLYRAIKGSIGNSRAHQFTTCMIDLYALPDYPGQNEHAGSQIEKVCNIEKALREKIDNPRWIPYIQLHEFEALLFVDLSQIDAVMSNYNVCTGAKALQAEVAHQAPEEIDEGKDSAPSKRILRHIPEYAKAQVGPTAAARIGLAKLRESCPHFDEWIKAIEAQC